MAHGKKTGGRKAGTPNKVTADLKSRINALIEEQFDAITGDLEHLEPKDRIAAYLKFLEYVLPKQREQKTDVNARLDTLNEDQLNSLIDKVLANA
ncbi:hypothetical protein [Fibrella arboris]|uniref:hypothetical protein n=1 Tax=Fibrella arboris TaxID=3242486 RepID=UPI0035223997